MHFVAEASRFFMRISRTMEGISILYEEDSFIVLDKPTGLLSQSTYGVDSLLFRVRAYLRQREGTRMNRMWNCRIVWIVEHREFSWQPFVRRSSKR